MPISVEPPATLNRADALADAMVQLRNEGYDLVIRPVDADVPGFAAGLRPAVLARRDAGGVIVVVRTRAELAADPMLAAAVAAAHSHPEWRLDVLVRAPTA